MTEENREETWTRELTREELFLEFCKRGDEINKIKKELNRVKKRLDAYDCSAYLHSPG